MPAVTAIASSATSVLAIGWEPELRGITIVAMAVALLCGSVYLVLSTNLGARLGLLVALAALAGWLMLLGGIWWIYGIGLRGRDPSWDVKQVVYGEITDATLQKAHDLSTWTLLPEDDPGRGQVAAAADEVLLNETDGRFAAGDYVTVAVYDKGGETWPDWFFNIFHKPHYAVVEVQPTIKQATEPGRSPPTPTADPNQDPVFVVLERNLGDRRFPAAMITISSGIIFAVLCNMLHRRERLVRRHLQGEGEPLPVEVRTPTGVGT